MPGTPILGTKVPWFTRTDMRDKVRSTEAIAANLDVTANQRSLLNRLNQSQGAMASRDKKSSQADKPGQQPRAEKDESKSTEEEEAPHAPSSDAAQTTEPVQSAEASADTGSQPTSASGSHGDGAAQPTSWADSPEDDRSRPTAQPGTYESQENAADLDAADDENGRDITEEALVYAWQPKRVPPVLRPLWTIWCLYMIPRPDTPLNIRHDTGEIIPHPKDVSDGLWIVRLWDIMAWYTGHPDGRYELYDLKRRRRQWDGLEWRLHLLKCWIRNEPRGLPPGLQPKGDPPDHVTFRERISPATKDIETSDARYDPVANAVKVPHTSTEAPPPSVEWEPCDVGLLPQGQPSQLVFEHVLSADDPSGHPDNVSFTEFMRVKIEQDVLVEALLRHRQPLNEADMLFFKQWPEIPRHRAAQSGMGVSGWTTPLKDWNAVLWIDKIDDEWRLFRQAVYGPTGTPLGAAHTWPITDHNLEWLDKPIVRRPITQDAWE